MVAWRIFIALNPTTEPGGVTVGMFHVYVVLGGAVVGVTSNAVPLQITAVLFGKGANALPTVTVTVKEDPEQLPESGETVYTACAGVLVAFTNLCDMVEEGGTCAVPPTMAPNGKLTGTGHV